MSEGESVSVNETKSIRVSFDANGGILESEADAKQIHIGESYGILPTVSRENYHFLGWYTDKAKGEKVEASTKVTCSENHILYARWEIITYTVTFDAMGGNADKKIITVNAGKTYGKLPEADRNGYVFSGWYTASENGICITETTKVTIKSNQTLYAKWEYIEIAVKQKYDISGFFEDVTDMKGYMILEGKGKASISKKGILTAKKSGEVVIIPYKVEGRKKVPVDGIEPLHLILKKPYVSDKLMLTSPNQVEDLNTYLADLPGNSNAIKWTVRSSKNPIVTLSGENANQISPVRNGRVRVTAEITNDQNYVLKIPMTVTVKMPKQVNKKVSVSVDKTKKLKFSSLTGQTILWESKNPEIATVDSDGKVYGISKGETVVAATIDDTVYEFCISVK